MSIETSRLAVNDQTAEIITRIPVTTWADGSPITDARCGGLYNRDSLGYFKLGFAGEFPISRLKNPTLANIQKLIADVGTDGNVTIVIDKIVEVAANSNLPVSCNIRIQSGGGFNVSSGVTFAIGAPITLPPNQVFYGEGLVLMRFTKDFDPRWWGAQASTGSSTYMSGAAFNKCALAAQTANSNMVIPPGTFDMEVTFDPPANLQITGGGWQNTIIRGAADGIPVISLASSNILRDVFVRGSARSSIGVNCEGLINRINLRNIRIDSCTQDGFYCTALQNSLIEEVFVQDSGVNNFHLGGAGPENCTFFNCNGNFNSSAGVPSRRNLYIEDSRNCRFIGGIFERGGIDYPIYVENSQQLDFIGGEIQSSGAACVYVANGGAAFILTSFAVPTVAQGGYLAETGPNGLVRLTNYRATGTEGRSELDLFNGNVQVNYDLDIQLINENYRYARYSAWQAISNTTVTKIQPGRIGSFGGFQRVVTTSAVGGALKSSSPGTIIPAGQPLRVKFTLRNINENGTVNLFQTDVLNNEVRIGTFSEGSWDIMVVNDNSDTVNNWTFRNNQNVASKEWEIYEFYVDAVNGKPRTIEQLGIKPNYHQLTESVIDLMYNVSGEIDLNANTTFSFTNPTNGVAQDYSIYNASSQEATIQFTNASVTADSSLTIPPNQYAHMRISVHRSQPEVAVKLLLMS